MNKKILLIILVILIVGGGAFYAGLSYGKTKVVKNIPMNFDNNRMGSQIGNTKRTGQGNGSAINGEILSKDDKSITMKLNDGGSKIGFFTASTTISKSTEGIKDDLVSGKQVMVFGSANSDGSINIQSIQLRDALPVQDIKK
ncbi:MAG: hypothetical protein PHZ07_04085 [Patescibacteria group bacterium]|nr:hypothetical protein [Patescibacteria group bacterium]MDD4304491.1 hypothetical protein [Patescibacteria group bacterium]MDD4694851.1 hypothetical protein [Patescibacteria group bacterium]